MVDQLDLAITLAVEAHAGQKDKQGKPYILHPLHLMSQFDDPMLASIAVLHDVLEDTKFTVEHLLKAGVSSRILVALVHLTHKKGVKYSDYIDGLSHDSLAVAVKLKDMEHNARLDRVFGEEKDSMRRMSKYHAAYWKLKNL